MKVLLIEDSDVQAQEYTQEFNGQGIEVVHVPDLVECHNIAGCDIVVLDLMLPSSGGVETVKRCRAAFPHLPIVVYSKIESVETQARCLQAGAEYFFRKGEQDIKVILRAMEAAIVAFMARRTQQGEIQATTVYVARAQELLDEINRRLLELG